MFKYKYTEKFKKRYVEFWIKLLKIDKVYKPYVYNFSKGWNQIIFDQKILFFSSSLLYAISTTVFAYIPLLLANIINDRNFNGLIIMIGVYILISIFEFISNFIIEIYLNNTIQGYANTGFEKLLKSDVKNHITKGTGKSISKLNRGKQAIDQYLNTLIYEVIPNFTQIGIVIFAFFSLNVTIGLATLIFSIVIQVISIYFRYLHVATTTKFRNNSYDQSSDILTESLNQIMHVRSLFMTKKRVKDYRKSNSNLFRYITGPALSNNLIFLIIYALIWGYLFGVIWYFMKLIEAGSLAPVLAIGYVGVYIGVSTNFARFGRIIQSYLQAKEDFKDSYEYIKNYGDQSFPI